MRGPPSPAPPRRFVFGLTAVFPLLVCLTSLMIDEPRCTPNPIRAAAGPGGAEAAGSYLPVPSTPGEEEAAAGVSASPAEVSARSMAVTADSRARAAAAAVAVDVPTAEQEEGGEEAEKEGLLGDRSIHQQEQQEQQQPLSLIARLTSQVGAHGLCLLPQSLPPPNPHTPTSTPSSPRPDAA